MFMDKGNVIICKLDRVLYVLFFIFYFVIQINYINKNKINKNRNTKYTK